MLRVIIVIESSICYSVYPAYAGMFRVGRKRRSQRRLFIPQVRGCFVNDKLQWKPFFRLSRICGGDSCVNMKKMAVGFVYPACAGMFR